MRKVQLQQFCAGNVGMEKMTPVICIFLRNSPKIKGK